MQGKSDKETRYTTFTVPGSDEEMAVIPKQALDQLMNQAAELKEAELDLDAAAYARGSLDRGAPTVNSDQLDRLLNGESPLRIWREAASLTQAALATKIGISQSYIADLESGKKEGGVRLWKNIAEAIGVEIEDLV